MYYIKNLNRPRKKKRRFLILLIPAFLVAYWIFNLSPQQPVISTSFLAANNPAQPQASPTEVPNSTSIEAVVQQALQGTKGSYAVAIKNLKTGEVYNLNQHQLYETGSLYKLWVMVTVYKQIESGELTEDQVLSEDISDLNAKFGIAEEDAELTEGAISMPISRALTQMITISHNYAALLLTQKVKLSNVSDFLENNGFKDSKVGSEANPPTSTAADMALFMEKLYQGQLVNPENTNKMLILLKGQKLNDKLPKNLPKPVIIAHKTGEIGMFSHDAGIVFSEKGDYIIVVMSETKAPAAAEDRIADISEAVYRYFNQK